MEWFKFYVKDLKNRLLLVTDDAAVGHWVRMLAACYDSENGGRFERSKDFSSRQWLVIAGVDRRAVERVVAAGLASWSDDGSLQIAGYDRELQEKATERSRQNSELAQRRWKKGNAEGITKGTAKGNAEGEGEGKGETELEGEEKDLRSPGGDHAGGGYSDSFVRFWSAWPKKVAKEGAWNVWRTKHCEAHVDAILSALAWQTTSGKWTADGGQYIPHPDKYLRGKLWEDAPNAYTAKPTRDISVGNTRAEEMDHSGPIGEVDLRGLR
jgi:hypothetical protein